MSSQPLLQSAPGTSSPSLHRHTSSNETIKWAPAPGSAQNSLNRHVGAHLGAGPSRDCQQPTVPQIPTPRQLRGRGESKGSQRASRPASQLTAFRVDGAADEGASNAGASDATSTLSIRPLLPGGKRISLPVRVEPKVFFANERTFLSWLNFAVILGGLAIGLLNFGDKVGQISALLFTIVAMAAMLYALGVFHWRAGRIRRRGAAGGAGAGGTGVGGFDDRFGPTVLTIALAAAVIVNFVLRVVIGESKDGSDVNAPRRPGMIVQTS